MLKENDWAALGLAAGDLAGFRITPGGLGAIVRAPGEISVDAGKLSFDGPEEARSRVVLDDEALTLRLPLRTLPGARVAVVPPPDGLPPEVDLRVTEHGDAAPEVSVVWRLRGSRRVSVRAGEPIAQVVPVKSAAPHEDLSSGDFTLRVWRLHPNGVRIVPAEKTLRGEAPGGAVRWCGPFTHANAFGFWVFPPVDLDIVWYGGRSYDWKLVTPYADDDLKVMQPLERPEDKYRFAQRKKLDPGGVIDAVVTMWTGCAFQTPPGWGLQIRSPINIVNSTIFRVQEAILETDWLHYDIWLNLLFVQPDKWVHLRREQDWPPIAQLVPVRREGYERRWTVAESMMERTTPEGARFYEQWADYNYKKWLAQGEKDPQTYHRERHRAIRGEQGAAPPQPQYPPPGT